jgi:hypothetical protein
VSETPPNSTKFWFKLRHGRTAWAAVDNAGLSHISVASLTGGGEKNFAAKEDAWGQRNTGCIRQPFPDVCMALTMIWYLTDGNERTGGTWIVPGSHRDHRNPRGLHDNMNVA